MLDVDERRLQRASNVSSHFALFRKSAVDTSDGVRLDVFETGETELPPVILIGPYGMPVGFFRPLATALGARFRFLGWESRGILNTDQPFDERRCDVGTQSDDLRAILDARGIERIRVIAWCSGALVALRFASEVPRRIEKAVLLSGAFPLPGFPVSQFSKEATELFRRCASSRSRARAVWQLLFSAHRTASGGASLLSHWGKLTPALMEMAQGPYRSPEALYRFANTVLRAREEPMDAWLPKVNLPLLFVGGCRDAIAHPKTWEAVSRRIAGSRLILKRDGDHLMFYEDDALFNVIEKFLDGHDVRAPWDDAS